ncbi:unnamed protein product [Calypogeia fissa]
MKRRFASPLVTRNSALGEAGASSLSKPDRCLSQPEMRRFTSPLVFKRAPELSLGSVSKEQSMDVPKTLNPSLRAESGKVKCRLFHTSERSSQINDFLSTAPIGRTTPRPPVSVEADKRGTHEVVEASKSGPGDLQRQASCIRQRSIDLQPDIRESLAQSSDAPPIQLSNNNNVSDNKPRPGRKEEFSQLCHNLSMCEANASNLDTKQASGFDNHPPAGNLSQSLLKSEIGRNKRSGSGRNPDVSLVLVTSPEDPMKFGSQNICSLQVFSYPPVTDIAAVTCNGASLLETIIEYQFMEAQGMFATSPTLSVQESKQVNECPKKLKMLLVPSCLPFADLVQQNRAPISVLQTLFEELPSNHLSRNKIRENSRNFEAVYPLEEDRKGNECINISAVKTTKLLQQVSEEKYIQFRHSRKLQQRTSNHLQMIHAGALDNNNHTALTPLKVAKSRVTIACTQTPTERRSPSSLYAAQSMEFRSIWSSKRLQMAEIAVACLTQNEFLFSTLG